MQCRIFKPERFKVLSLHALFLYVSVVTEMCNWKIMAPSLLFQQQNVIGARNMGCFVGQEVTEGIFRHAYFRSRICLATD